MLALSIHLYLSLSSLCAVRCGMLDAGRRRLRTDERGQASAEYALVLLGAAAVALLVVAWATKTDLVEKLLDKVLQAITGRAS